MSPELALRNPPRWQGLNVDLPLEHCPLPDREAIHEHIAMLHGLATGIEGDLVLCAFGEDPLTGIKLTTRVARFTVGDVDSMANQAMRWTVETHRNVYLGLHVMRRGLTGQQRGAENDIVAVLGLVADFDDPEASNYRVRLPLNADLVLETSQGRNQAFYLFEHPEAVADVKPIALALRENTKADHGTADVAHVWRIAGTLNWPNKKKTIEGRPLAPQRVEVIEAWGRTRTRSNDLKTALQKTSTNAGTRTALNLRSCPDISQKVIELKLQSPKFFDTWERRREDFGDPSQSTYDLALCSIAAHRGWKDDELAALICEHRGHDEKSQRIDYIQRTIAKARQGLGAVHEENVQSTALILSPKEPLQAARKLISLHYTRDNAHALHFWQGGFYQWIGGCYQQLSTDDVKARLWTFLDQAQAHDKNGQLTPYRPNRNKVGDVLEALGAETNLDGRNNPPCWINGTKQNPKEIIACANGLLHLPTGRLFNLTPEFFNLNALNFDYRHDAETPIQWLNFLHDLWPNDPQSIDALQEIFGYLLGGDTALQKTFLIVGPKRSGKGTLARILCALLGQENVVGPTLASLAQNFGLAPLIGKQVAIISDARLSGKADQSAIAERLLAISGEDAISIPRKFKEDYTARLGVRFLIMTNELPRLADASGALASRFIVLTLEQSFYGKEDPGLTNKLLTDLPGVLNWSINGWRRLKTRGYFVQPDSARNAISDMEDLGSHIGAFLRDKCDVGSGYECECSEMFKAWKSWCGEQGREHPGTIQTFGRDLRAAIPGIITGQRRGDGERSRVYMGVKLQNCHAVAREAGHCGRIFEGEINSGNHNADTRVPPRDIDIRPPWLD